MKTTFKFAFAICMALFVSIVTANAQAVTTGTINFSVTVNDAFDLRSNGPSTGAGGFAATTPGVANQALGVILTVADASPNSGNNTMTASVPIRMRSNRDYALYATRNNTDSASAADFESSDITMGLTSVVRSGLNVLAGTDTPATGWATGGGKKVGDLTATQQKILDGSRISQAGNNLSGDNFATSSVEFSIARGYYTPTVTPYLEQVTLVIAAP